MAEPPTSPHDTPPVSCGICRLGHHAAYGAIASQTPNIVNSLRRAVKTYPAGRLLLREGEVQTQVHTLYSGWAYRFINLSKGRQILFFHIPGDLITLESLAFPGMALSFAVRSLTPVTVCSFATEDAAALLQTHRPQQVHTAVVAQRFFADLYRHLADIGRRSAIGRVSQLLIEIEARLSSRQLSQGGSFAFPIRQEHLADALGLTTVYVNRTLDKLRKSGIIAFDRNRMSLLNIERLRELAQEE